MLERLLGRFGGNDDEELTPEELKAQRIQWHRDHVRNGPAKFATITSGQQRRRIARDQAALQKKATRSHRRTWHQRKREFAALRGHLIILGVVECKGDRNFTAQQRQISLEWVVAKYGQRDDDGALVLDDSLVEDSVAAARDAFLKVVKAAQTPVGASA